VAEASEPAEAEALQTRYQHALDDIANRNLGKVLALLEEIVEKTRVVVSVQRRVLETLAVSDDSGYRNFHAMRATGIRIPNESPWVAPRIIADTWLFPEYYFDITFGCLSCDGTGLDKYGNCYIQLHEHLTYYRTSILEEDAVQFIRRFGLMNPVATNSGNPPAMSVPRGYRAAWPDRKKIAVAKLFDKLSNNSTKSELLSLVMRSGDESEAESFIEAQLFGPITRGTFERVTVRPQPTATTATEVEKQILVGISEKLRAVNVDLVFIS